jgi:hypothetical protein
MKYAIDRDGNKVQMLETKDLMDEFEVTKVTVSNWVAGGMPAYRSGARRYYPAVEARQWINERGFGNKNKPTKLTDDYHWLSDLE